MSRRRTGHYPGQWLDEGPGAAPMSAHISGSIVVGMDIARTICGMPLTTGGGCARYTGHMGHHSSREAMDLQKKRRVA